MFQGAPSTAGEALDSALDMVRKRTVPRIKPADAWPRWKEGKPYGVTEQRLDELIDSRRLPPVDVAGHQGFRTNPGGGACRHDVATVHGDEVPRQRRCHSEDLSLMAGR
jgi:hypothetical protein